MSNVFANFDSYRGLFAKFDREIIEKRYEALVERYEVFIKERSLTEYVFLNKIVLQHAVLDYYSDIGRLKDYHKIETTNKAKVIAYESYWLWRRKPLQIKTIPDETLSETEYVFTNELFVYTNILSSLTYDIPEERYKQLSNSGKTLEIDSFMQTLYYFLKFRHCNSQVFELVILAFLAGRQFNDE